MNRWPCRAYWPIRILVRSRMRGDHSGLTPSVRHQSAIVSRVGLSCTASSLLIPVRGCRRDLMTLVTRWLNTTAQVPGTSIIACFTAHAVQASSWNSKNCTAILDQNLPPAGIVAIHNPYLSPDAWLGCILSLLVTI
jgi:hypothetical protein